MSTAAVHLHGEEPRPEWQTWSYWRWWLWYLWWTFIAIVWKLFSLVVVGGVSIIIVSEGARSMFPVLAQRLHRLPVPFVANMRNYEGLDRIDLAHLFTLLLLLAAWKTWVINLWVWMAPDDFFARTRWDPDRFAIIARALGAMVLGTDLCMFYMGMSAGSLWGAGQFSITSLIGTIAYGGGIIFVSLVTVMIEHKQSGGNHQ